MKLYQLRTISNPHYAHIHAQMGQDTSIDKKLSVTWDNYLAKGNLISDFCYSSYLICLRCIAEKLIEKYTGLSYIELSWGKNPKELISKNPKKLKWLPQSNVDYVHILSYNSVPFLDISTLRMAPNLCTKLPAIGEIIGGSYYSISEKKIIPREEGHGLFISEKTIEHLDFFCPLNTPILLCKEYVKDEIEKEDYKGLIFLEVGETIRNF